MTDYKHFPRIPRNEFAADLIAAVVAAVVLALIIAGLFWAIMPPPESRVPLSVDKAMLKFYTAEALAKHTEQTNAHYDAIAARGNK